jgi:hypothetical protein
MIMMMMMKPHAKIEERMNDTAEIITIHQEDHMIDNVGF